MTRDEDEKPERKGGSERDAILARRRYFVASALAGFALTSCDKVTPQPCLEVAPAPTPISAADASAPASAEPAPSAPPMPCLEIAEPPPTPTASSDARDAGKTDAPDAKAVVKPLPTPAPSPTPPRPRPCLKIALPKDEKF